MSEKRDRWVKPIYPFFRVNIGNLDVIGSEAADYIQISGFYLS
jgi:hypothetical protein